ncbi:MAG TPA: hypothetical protein VFF39_07965 [Verrucomicrobiae bacterium]|nr:hypothetical protein [Verrucomicrobiae bacterium]
MSNFVVAVGGSGAKLMQSLVHMGAAGLLPAQRRKLFALLVDPDENNGNVQDCQALVKTYNQCHELLKTGSDDLFSAAINLEGPWTPIRDPRVDTLSEIFQYDKLVQAKAPDAELLDLFFEKQEINMSIKQGFRGRPSVGATVFAHSVRFDEPPWSDLKERIKAQSAEGSVRVILAGSVFGGSGASGVPTLVRLLASAFGGQVTNMHLGLVLFLPFFQFRPVPGEEIQADPAAFPMATAEALKYYHERGFLDFCNSIYCVGEEVPSQLVVSAVGAAEQRNEPHFIELVAGMGTMRFFNDQLPSKSGALAVAGRKSENTVAWDDLPYDEHKGRDLTRKLQQMAVFSVAYRYIFYPQIEAALTAGKSQTAFWVDHVERPKVDRALAGRALRELYDYVGKFLEWFLRVSTPHREGFVPGAINPNVFAVRESGSWRLKQIPEFNDRDFPDLLLNRLARTRLDCRSIYEKSARAVNDKNAAGPGLLVRAIYDACAA